MATNANNRLLMNLLWYDENIFKQENEKYRLNLTEIIQGVFIPCTTIELLHGVLEDLERRETKQFVIISSGAASAKVFNEIQGKQNIVVSVVIFCYELKNWIHLKGTENVVEVVNEFGSLLSCLKKLAENYKFENIVDECRLFPIDVYNNTLRAVHLSLASRVRPNFLNVEDYTNRLLEFKKFGENFNEDFTDVVHDLTNNLGDFKTIISTSYMGETPLCYIINKVLRRCIPEEIEKSKIYAGTLMYALRTIAKERPEFQLNMSVMLYRGLKIDYIRLNNYYLNRGKVICFPAFTSTSLNISVMKRFPTTIATNVDKDQSNITHLYIQYHNKQGTWKLDPVQVYKFRGEDNDNEREVLFSAFSFFRIEEVRFGMGTKEHPNIIKLTYIHKKSDLESELLLGKTITYDPKLEIVLAK